MSNYTILRDKRAGMETDHFVKLLFSLVEIKVLFVMFMSHCTIANGVTVVSSEMHQTDASTP